MNMNKCAAMTSTPTLQTNLECIVEDDEHFGANIVRGDAVASCQNAVIADQRARAV